MKLRFIYTGQYLSQSKRRHAAPWSGTQKIVSTPLADLDKQFCAYEVDIYDTEIELYVSEYTNIEFDEYGVASSDCLVTPGIVTVEAPFIPLAQFAEIQSVKPVTVRQWIRRGKIRNVKKIGSEWFVAATEGKPERGFTSGTYYHVNGQGDLSDLSPLKKGTHSIDLWKPHGYVEECTMTLRDANGSRIDEIILNRTSREKLEVALAASPKVRFVSTTIDAISEKAPNSKLETNNCEAHETVLEYVEQANISKEHAAIIEVIAKSASIDEALVRILETIGFAKDYAEYLDAKKQDARAFC